MLKPHDIVVCLKLLASRSSRSPTYASLSAALGLSSSEIHAAVKRACDAGLLRRLDSIGAATMPVPVRTALSEFLIHGLKYIWPCSRGALTRGVPTGSSLPAVASLLDLAEPEVPMVWAHPDGTVRGEAIEPLYPKATWLSSSDPEMHEWLALLDIVRTKTGREAKLAIETLQRRLS